MFDCKYKHLDLGLTRLQIKIVLDNYPEWIHKLYVVGCDWFANGVWISIKPFLEKRTTDKVNLEF